MNIENICSCFGHFKIREDDKEFMKTKLERTFLNLIENENVRKFLFGGFGEFDDLCYKIVSELKKSFNDIERIYCVENERLLRFDKRPKWLQNETYEQVVYLEPDFKYWYTQIYYRNCEMIKISDFVVFYVRVAENSGAYKALEYAQKAKKNIIKV